MSQRCVTHKYIDYVHHYALVVLGFNDCRDRDGGHGFSRCLIS
jgi:hypothetical protein